MENRIVWASEMAEAARAAGGDYKAVRAAVQAEAERDTPIYIGIVEGVNYNDKRDCYVAHWVASAQGKSSARVTNEVATFLLTHAFSGQAKPTVYAHMDAGIVDAVLLMFVSR